MAEYDRIYGKKIDVNNPEHQKVILKRNSLLKKCVETGIDLEDTDLIQVNVDITIKCVKCGNDVDLRLWNVDIDKVKIVKEFPPELKCNTCNTNYILNESNSLLEVKLNQIF
jgi:hypothetical protein